MCFFLINLSIYLNRGFHFSPKVVERLFEVDIRNNILYNRLFQISFLPKKKLIFLLTIKKRNQTSSYSKEIWDFLLPTIKKLPSPFRKVLRRGVWILNGMALTDTESRYPKIEREALAVEFTTSCFQMYLVANKHFKIATNHSYHYITPPSQTPTAY